MATRNLQITIFEAPPGSSRPARSGARGPGFDPEDNYVKPPPEDPEDNYVKPPPEDPEDNYVKPPPEDPEDNYVKPPPEDPWGRPLDGLAYGPAGTWVAAQSMPPAAAPAHGCCCAPCSCEESALPERPCVAPGDYSGFVIVRLADGVGPLTFDSLWELATAADLKGLLDVLSMSLPEVDAEGGETGAGERRNGRFTVEDPVEDQDPGAPAPPEPTGALVSRPLVQLRGLARAATVGLTKSLEHEAARTGFRPRHSLASYWRVDLRPYPDLVAKVVERLNELAEVDLAYRELRAIDTAHGDGPLTGGALGGDQAYFDPAPVGIGAGWLRRRLAAVMAAATKAATETPAPIQVIDLEQGWMIDHVELVTAMGPDPWVHGENRDKDEPGSGNHGTAVLGQLAAAGVGPLGVEGSATGVATFRLASHYRRKGDPPEPPTLENPFPGTNGHVASAIVRCLIKPSPLGAGDVLLLEVQRGRLPTETDEADFDAIRLATALGVIVVEAAGNGNHDLDRCGDPQTGRSLRRGAAGFADSGAILVGAAFSEPPHDRAPFSNYGSRLDCYGWGEGVTTCGYGDLHGGGGQQSEYYTNTFNGTSSAAPIIAGAAVLVQALHEVLAGSRLLPLPMRALLSSRATGTPQGPNVGGHIGVMPDLRAIVRDALQLVADLYVRRSPCDDGSPLGRGDEVSSSPDIVVFETTPSTLDLGESGPAAHHPAPGQTTTAGGAVYVRLRNRGCAAGSAEVLLYAAPAATLIGPDEWEPIGSTLLGPENWPTFGTVPPAGPVPPGDTLWPAAPVAFKPQGFADPTLQAPGSAQEQASHVWPQDAVRAWSFLAVFDPDGATAPHPLRALPPGGRFFDWRDYRRFLRGPGVAWRNVHPIVGGTAKKLVFFLAGAPDRTREFDLEVIQRLPPDTTVQLHMPRALASQLHQRQPGLEVVEAPILARLKLPQRRSTRFGRLRLPGGLRAPVGFTLSTQAPEGLSAGHSLALRQLWRGEEVGRITWYVTNGVP